MQQEEVEKLAFEYSQKIELLIADFCADNGIQDLSKETPNRFTAMLIYIGQNLFGYSNRYDLRLPEDRTTYNYDLLDRICDLYIFICYKYDKTVSLLGFSYLVNIPVQTVNDWNNKTTVYRNGYNIDKELSIKKYVIFKKIKQVRESGLVNKVESGKVNPVGLAILLNHEYGYNAPGIHETKEEKQERLERQQVDALPLPSSRIDIKPLEAPKIAQNGD